MRLYDFHTPCKYYIKYELEEFDNLKNLNWVERSEIWIKNESNEKFGYRPCLDLESGSSYVNWIGATLYTYINMMTKYNKQYDHTLCNIF